MKEIGYTILIKDEVGNLKDVRDKVVMMKTKGVLSAFHGRDKNKPLVVSLLKGDLIGFKPLRAKKGKITLSVFDAYHYALRKTTQAAALERAREKKEKKKLARERRALDRMGRKLRESA